MTTNDETFEKLLTVQRMTRALRRKNIADQGPLADHSRGQGRVMSLLKLKDGIATKDMAEILGIRVSSLNETLARMEKDGLIARTPSEADKRVMLVELTEAGKEAGTASNPAAAVAFQGIEESELATFASTLDTIAANLEAELGEDFQEFMERGRRRRKEFFDGPPHSESGPHHGEPHHGGPHHGGPRRGRSGGPEKHGGPGGHRGPGRPSEHGGPGGHGGEFPPPSPRGECDCHEHGGPREHHGHGPHGHHGKGGPHGHHRGQRR